MTNKHHFCVDGIEVTIEVPKALETVEFCPYEDSIILAVKDHLLLALQRPKKTSVVPV